MTSLKVSQGLIIHLIKIFSLQSLHLDKWSNIQYESSQISLFMMQKCNKKIHVCKHDWLLICSIQYKEQTNNCYELKLTWAELEPTEPLKPHWRRLKLQNLLGSDYSRQSKPASRLPVLHSLIFCVNLTVYQNKITTVRKGKKYIDSLIQIWLHICSIQNK